MTRTEPFSGVLSQVFAASRMRPNRPTTRTSGKAPGAATPEPGDEGRGSPHGGDRRWPAANQHEPVQGEQQTAPTETRPRTLPPKGRLTSTDAFPAPSVHALPRPIVAHVDVAVVVRRVPAHS